MNTIKRVINVDDYNILSYRKYQYSLLNDFIFNGLNYLNEFGFEYNDLESVNKTFYFYKTQWFYDLSFFKIFNKRDMKNPVVSMIIPRLLYDNLFLLNGVYYVPTLYIVDYPIVIKKNSIILKSTYCPITIFFKKSENRIIFFRKNIPIYRFLKLIYDTDYEVKNICDQLEIQYIKESNSIELLASYFNLIPEKEIVLNFFNKLFFDQWTKDLYHKIYGINDYNLKTIIPRFINQFISKEKNSFINLNYKRLTFIEILLQNYSKAIYILLNSRIIGDNIVSKIPVKSDCIISTFFNHMSGENYFDSSNSFVDLLTLKATFKTPKSKTRKIKSHNDDFLPDISSIHKTHKNKICPVTISNKSPGLSISLIPEQNVDLKFGLFENE